MTESGLFKQNAEPELWTNGVAAKFDNSLHVQCWAFGFWCGDILCLIPLADDVPEIRKRLWQSPICTSEEDAKRIWFIVKKLMLELESPELYSESVTYHHELVEVREKLGVLQHDLAEQKAENKRLFFAMRTVEAEAKQSRMMLEALTPENVTIIDVTGAPNAS